MVSLFDNIPLDLALDCIEEKLNLHTNLTRISKNEILIAVRTVLLSFKLILYKRYVDDILTIVSTDKIAEIFDVFNSIEKSIGFPFEKEENNTLNFLELEIIKHSNGSSITNWFEKPTWSGCYLNYESHHLFSQKIGLIKGLVDKCIKLSDIKYRRKNLDEIKVILQLNSYPLPLIECH